MSVIYYQGSTCIMSVGTYLPPQRVKTEDLLEEILPERFGITADFIVENMGIKEVRHSVNQKPSQVAIPAVCQALDSSPINPDFIDIIVFCGIEGDNEEPATAHHIQKALGLDCPICFDVKNACAGFVSGLQIVDALIGTGAVRYGLVCTGEVPSHVTKAATEVLRKTSDPKILDRLLGGFSVGDAGGAVIVGPGEGAGFMTFGVYSDSRQADLCYYNNRNGNFDGRMQMAKISAVGLKAHKVVFYGVLSNTGWQSDEIDCLITHQVGSRFFKKLSGLLNVPEVKMTQTYESLGNLTTASLPVNWLLAKNQGKLKPNSKVYMAMGGSGLAISHVSVTVQ